MADLGDALKSMLQVPGLQEMMNQSVTQQRQLAPVRTAVSQQALNMLPNSAFGAGGRPDVSAIPQANFTTPAPSGDHDLLKTLALLGAGGGAGAALMKLLGGNNGGANGGGGNLANLVNGLKKLFGHGANGLNYPNQPGNGFGGVGTTTVSGNDVDNTGNGGFTGPVNDPGGWGGDDATYEPGGYNFAGPMSDNGGGNDTTGNDDWYW